MSTVEHEFLDGQSPVVGIDIYNLEVEACGAKTEPCEGDAIPAIHRPLLATMEEGLALKPFDPQRDGRIAMSIAVRNAAREHPTDPRLSGEMISGGDWPVTVSALQC